VPHPCAFFLAQGWDTTKANHPCSFPTNLVAPGLDFETWVTAKANPSHFVHHKSPVPHPCAFFLAQGWDTSKLTNPRQKELSRFPHAFAPFAKSYHQIQTGDQKMAEFTLRIEGMHCGSCIRRVSQALASAEGMQVEEVRLGAARLRTNLALAPVDLAVAALARAGYSARLET
jgi:copper chaperone CopZ